LPGIIYIFNYVLAQNLDGVAGGIWRHRGNFDVLLIRRKKFAMTLAGI
jgi:hypothetical protein